MNKSKVDFISDLLTHKGISVAEKERLFLLAKEEIKKMREDDRINEILERIERLEGSEKEMKDKKEKEISAKKEKNDIDYPYRHNAPRLVELLNFFSSNGKALKYTTHSWEYGKFDSYSDFLSKISIEWKEISSELNELNNRLQAKISNFLFNSKLGEKKEDGTYHHYWGEKFLNFGWSSVALKDYMSCSSDKDPFACPIPEDIRKLDKKHSLLYFKDYVSAFKNEIEIREDNNALEKLLNDLWENSLSYDFKLEQKNTRGISFFTDVVYFKSSIKLIFKNFATRPQHRHIIVAVDTNFQSKYMMLKIMQKESVCNRNIDDPKIVKPCGGDMATIITNLKNLADFSIVSRFPDNKTYKVNYMCSNKDAQNVETIETVDFCEGFTYEIKLYL